MMNTRVAVLCVGAALLSSAEVLAVTATSNVAEVRSGSAQVSFGLPPAGAPPDGLQNEVAGSFTAGNSTTLTGVKLQMNAATLTNSAFLLQLRGDDAGLPGLVLTNFSGDSNPATAGLYTYTPTTSISLVGGAQYWISATNISSQAGAYFWAKHSVEIPPAALGRLDDSPSGYLR